MCLCQSVMGTMQSSVLQICMSPLHRGFCTSCAFITSCSNIALLILLCRVRDSSLDNDSCCAYSNLHSCGHDLQEREAKIQVNVACIHTMHGKVCHLSRCSSLRCSEDSLFIVKHSEIIL